MFFLFLVRRKFMRNIVGFVIVPMVVVVVCCFVLMLVLLLLCFYVGFGTVCLECAPNARA